MKTMPISPINRRTTHAAAARRVFAGEVLQFGGLTPLVDAARALCQEVFACDNPQLAHTLYDGDEFLRRAADAQQRFDGAEYKQQFADWLTAQGLAADTLYWDTLGLRIAPPLPTHRGGFRSSIGVHRDTWGTAIGAQINWWAPVYPLASRRTMAFYPDYWQQPLKNSTGEWSFKEYLASRRDSKETGRAAQYPSAPSAKARPNTPRAIVLPPCGTILAFSAAHLHASVPNSTNRTRYSLEIRTVDAEDMRRGREAPNVDCESDPPLYKLFARITDGEKNLSEARG